MEKKKEKIGKERQRLKKIENERENERKEREKIG